MFAKLSTVVALLSVAAQVAVASPPACLIGAVNTQSDPSDVKSVCKASEVQKYMQSNCGDNLQAAQSALADVCKAAGVTVSSSSSSSSTSDSSSQTDDSSSATATGTKHSSQSSASAYLPSATLTNGISIATGTPSGGFVTQTQSANATGYSAPSATGDASSGSGSAQASPSMVPNTGGAARLGMDVMGLAAVGLAGFMIAL